jgi:hypothetical protein
METFYVLRPFRFDVYHRRLYSLLLLSIVLLSTLISIFLLNFSSSQTSIIFTLLLLLSLYFENRLLYDTEIIGQISIDHKTIYTERRDFEIALLNKLTIKKHLGNTKSFIPGWKSSYEIVLLDNQNNKQQLLISKFSTKNTEILDFIELVIQSQPDLKRVISILD